jgi:PKD repeat protein
VNGMDMRAEAIFDPSLVAGKSLLLEWDFGDRSKSLLSTPIHRYNIPGTYILSLTARNITTGEIVYEGKTNVQILPSVNQSSTSSSSSSETLQSSASSDGTSNSSIGSIVTVVVIILALLMIAGGLYAVLTWIKKRTTYSIQKTLEKVEETIVRKDAKEEVIATVAPMSMKKSEDIITDREKSTTEFASKERTQITPTSTAGPVPSWLQKAPKEPAATPSRPVTQPIISPKPPPQPTPPRAPLSNTSVAASKEPQTKPQLPTETGPVPDWLKPTKQESPPPAKVITPPIPQKPVIAEPTIEKSTPKIEQETQKVPEKSTPLVVPKDVPVATTTETKTDDESRPSADNTVTPLLPQTESVTTPAIAKTTPKTQEEIEKVPEKNAPLLVPKDIPLATTPDTKKGEEPPIAIIQADSLMK